MKKETINKIEEEINKKIILPDDLKEKLKKNVFTNIIIAISMIIYFTFLIVGSKETLKIVQPVHFNIFSILLLGITICLFEIAYKKDNVSLAIYGIETLMVSILTLFFPYIIFELDEFSKKYYMIVSAYIAIYYIIKSICIVGKTKKIHIKQSSDIKEIVKKERRKDVIRVKEKTVDADPQNDLKKKQTKKLETTKNKQKNNVGVALQGDLKPKKRGRPKKSETTNNENKNNVGVAPLGDQQTQNEQKPKKRGRPKKIETTNNENKNNVGVALQDAPKPKKRGRPRKVVTADD